MLKGIPLSPFVDRKPPLHVPGVSLSQLYLSLQ
jgi:hypothetical protein